MGERVPVDFTRMVPLSDTRRLQYFGGAVGLVLALAACGDAEPDPSEICAAYVDKFSECDAISEDVSLDEFHSDCEEDISNSSGDCQAAIISLYECRAALTCDDLLSGVDCDPELEELARACE